MKYTLITLAALAGVTHAQNLITNGSFENPAGPYTNLPSGSGSVPGWNVSGSSVSVFGVVDFQPSGAFVSSGIAPASSTTDGVKALDLATNNADVTIAQTVGTSAGTSYNLTFDLGSTSALGRNGIGNYELLLNGNVVANYHIEVPDTTVIRYFSRSYAFTGTGSDTIAFRSVGSTYTASLKQDFAFIDNVSLTPVPEPSSAALLGLGGLALILRRRK